jgi:Mn2+/Fe2+ NRAMP family transporter
MRRNAILKLLSLLGPGIFAIGYTIGTGSVTSMAMTGADYGLKLAWALLLSCVFSGMLMEAYGRFACVTGETSLHGVRRYIPGGTLWAVLVFIGVVVGQYTCMGGILTLSSGAICEMLTMFFPGIEPGARWMVLTVAVLIMGFMLMMMLIGRYGFFEKLLAFFVMIMGLTFIASAFVVWPDAATMKRALPPLIPSGGEGLLMLASLVGTTLAAPTFVTRPLLIKEKGGTAATIREHRIDSAVSATLMFVISGSIMLVATGSLFSEGKTIVKILDMAHTLEPLAGRFAVVLFMFGILAAGLSSIFPIMMVAPLLMGDWKSGAMDTKSRSFRMWCLVASLAALIVPFLGGNPVFVTIMAQISNVFVLPLTVAVILYMLNRKAVMGEHRAGVLLNIGLVGSLIFALAIAYAGVVSLIERFTA